MNNVRYCEADNDDIMFFSTIVLLKRAVIRIALVSNGQYYFTSQFNLINCGYETSTGDSGKGGSFKSLRSYLKVLTLCSKNCRKESMNFYDSKISPLKIRALKPRTAHCSKQKKKQAHEIFKNFLKRWVSGVTHMTCNPHQI